MPAAATPDMVPTALPASAAELPLRDIHLPDAISWWPPAPGWWMLLALIIVIVVAIVAYRRYHARRRALYSLEEQLSQIQRRHQQSQDAASTVEQLSVLLRRACLSFFPRSDVASLTGEHWLAFLNRHTDDSFTADTGTLLTVAPYRKPDDIDVEQVSRLIGIVQQQLPVLFSKAGRAR